MTADVIKMPKALDCVPQRVVAEAEDLRRTLAEEGGRERELAALERLLTDGRMHEVWRTLQHRKRDDGAGARFQFPVIRGALWGYEDELNQLDAESAQELALAQLLRQVVYAISTDIRVNGRKALEDEASRVAKSAVLLEQDGAMAFSHDIAAKLRDYETYLAERLRPNNPLLVGHRSEDDQAAGLQIAVQLAFKYLFGTRMLGLAKTITSVALERSVRQRR